MAKTTTPSFVTEIPLKVGSYEQSILKKRFFAAKQQYNALLGEALKRLSHMRKDGKYSQTIQLYKQKGKKLEAKAQFKKLAETHGYREYDLYAYSKQWNKKKHFLSIGARISQQLAKRAFQAVEEYKLKKRGKPRFKGRRGINSIEDNSIDANLRLKNNLVYYLGIQLPLMIDPKDPIHQHGLEARIKYIRIVRKNYNGKTRYVAQLICEGTPYIKAKNTPGEGVVGLDVGPQTIAIVSAEKRYASLQVFADELKTHKKKKKQLQRKLARQLRSNNPDAYEKDTWQKKDKQWKRKKGKSIKGKSLKNRSKSLRKTLNKLISLDRKQAAHRKTQHGRLVNTILKIGNQINTEKISYKAFQKNFGKSVGLRAPGMFIEKIRRKAENAGGKTVEFNTYQTKLSQTCHCGKIEKKKLSKRFHTCSCGVNAQRDLYSAYLACFVKNDRLMADQAKKSWSGMDIALRTAMSKLKHSISKPLPASIGYIPVS